MNKRGQALVEFVLILPILLLLIFAFFDISRIILCQNSLENKMNDVIDLIKDNRENEIVSFLKKDKDYDIKYSINRDEYLNITLETKLDLITPGLKNILKNPYDVKVKRSVLS